MTKAELSITIHCMTAFIIITLVFIFVISLCTAFLAVRLINLSSQVNSLYKYIKFAKNKINSVRLGDYRTRMQTEKDSLGLYKSLNDLFESIYDRDLVINEYREKEKENLSLKEEFIAALTHDLKVPIIAQDKTYDLLLQNKFGVLDEEIKYVVLKLKESGEGLMQMVNSILETHKIENTGISLNINHDTDVENFLNECIDGLNSLASTASKKINLYSRAKDLRADFDKLLIKRAVNNLIVNALNHSKTDKIDIFLKQGEDKFSIEVIDYGEGIDEEEIEKIFNKYYSITSKLTRVSSGLGLYLSNKIVKKHNGSIEVKSKKNEGSIFRITLPIKNKNNTP